MTGGQNSLALGEAVRAGAQRAQAGIAAAIPPPAALRVIAADAAEQSAHDEFMKLVSKASGGKALWL
jgi:hypothetical protein